MLEKTSQDFRKLFLLEFTRQIIKNTQTEAIFELQERLNAEAKTEKEKIKEKTEKMQGAEEIQNILQEPLKNIMQKNISVLKIPKPLKVLRIPEPRLPPHLQYLKPYATGIEIDLGKLNPLLKDFLVREIECLGEDENVIVRGGMGEKQTNIILSEGEIEQIIDAVSKISKIPREEGLFRAVVGKINFSAIISENGSRFVIKKLESPRIF